MFHVDIAYAYVGKTNASSTTNPLGGAFTGMQMYPVDRYPPYILLNLTLLDNPQNETCDAKFEEYNVQLTSDTGTTQSFLFCQDTNFNPSWNGPLPPIPSTPSGPGVVAVFFFNWTLNQSHLGIRITNLGSYSSSGGDNGLWSAGTPNAISITLRRVGWIIINGASPSTFTSSASADVILQVQLQKFGDGFLYNKIVLADEMPQIDPFNPPT